MCNSVLAADGLVVTMAKTSSILTDSVWFACTVTVTEIAHSVERPTQKPGTILTRVRVPGAARDFSLSVQTLLLCPYSPRVQSHTSASGRAPNTGSHIMVWPHDDTVHSDRNG